MTTRALITGISGQDGSYLTEQLLERGIEVHGIVRPSSNFTDSRLEHIYVDPHDKDAKLFTHLGDVGTGGQLADLINDLKPDYIYSLAAQSHVKRSFDMPEYTCDIVGLGTVRLLEAVRKAKLRTRIYFASSSEIFGNQPAPQNESTPFEPRSPYACAKVFAHQMCKNYREGYSMFISCGILYNHESPRRLPTMVTRKITIAVAMIKKGLQSKLYLGNIKARRDWGYAPEYTECMVRLLELDRPYDIVIGTGESHSVEEFLGEAFGYVDLDWHDYVVIDQKYFRPTEVDYLMADSTKAQQLIGWNPKVKFKELVKIMVDADLKALDK